MAKIIVSADNILIKRAVKLGRDSSYRKELEQAIIYGHHLVIEAIKSNIIELIFVSELSSKKYAQLLLPIALNKICIVSDTVMAKLNLLDSPTDIVGIIKVVKSKLDKAIYSKDCVILDNISDPGNLGTILRAVRAAGVKNVITSNDCVDAYNIKVLRASAGIQFGLNILENLDLADFVPRYNGRVFATTPHATDSLYDTALLASPIAWVFGHEGAGISKKLLAIIDKKISIPMLGDTESLNVAMAATICLFEMVRQRCGK